MESSSWIPLMNIFTNSHSPETQAAASHFLHSHSTASFLSLLMQQPTTHADIITSSSSKQRGYTRMESSSWIPLMNIFTNSHSPETQAASHFLHSHSHSTASFLSLLMQPTTTHADVITSSSSSSKQRFMWLQTLPDIVQARIISFLTYDHAKFNKHDLTKLARDLLSNNINVDYWVKKAAQQLLDVVSDSNYKWVSSFNLDSEEETLEGEFGGVPEWLKNVASESDSVLPWLPVSVDELNLREPNGTCEDDDELMEDVEEGKNGSLGTVDTQKKSVHHEVVPIDHETEETAACLKMRLLNMESSLKAAELVDDIHKLCLKRKKDSLTVLNLIEPWNANDEIVPVLLSGLLDEKEDDFILTSNILCSVLLPKFLVLEKPASRVLLTAAIPYCKVHHKAAVYAVLFPLILHKDGINNPICDVITRIIKECLHPAHASAFCQKLLCEQEVDENEYICIPSYQHLVSKHLVWTEPLFNLFQNILNHNVHLTQDSVDRLVFHVEEASTRFPASLKFANFLLCFVSKCAPLLKVHKVALSEAVGNTSSFLTKSILSKLDSI